MAKVEVMTIQRMLGGRVLKTLGYAVYVDGKPYRTFSGQLASYMAHRCADRLIDRLKRKGAV